MCKRFTKLTWSALLLSTTSVVTLQAQGEVNDPSNLALADKTSKVFLKNGVDVSDGMSSLLNKFLIFAGILVLVVALGLFAYYLANQPKKIDLSSVDQLIKELQELTPESFLKGDILYNDAKKRNNDKISDLTIRIEPFKIEGIDYVLKNFGEAANGVFVQGLKQAACKEDMKKNDKFLGKAMPMLEDLEKVVKIYEESVTEDKHYNKITDKEKINKITWVLGKYAQSDEWDFLPWSDFSEEINKMPTKIESILDKFTENNTIYYFGYWRSLWLCILRLRSEVNRRKKLKEEYHGAFDLSVKNFNENKQMIIDNLQKIKEEKNNKNKQNLIDSSQKIKKRKSNGGFLGLFNITDFVNH